ncbi:uncharacterized protein LOC141854651 [Brevipalpus obovatus]|uniref:uncharacterized protein LOC141854651 n=1 Tax=Brevipalpus obovatus TaxID=246614 RepID=UPI003D9ED224
MLKKVVSKTRFSRWMKYSLLIGSGATIAGGFIVSETRFRTIVSFDESNLDDHLKDNKAPTYIEASLVKLLPLKIISRIWGHVNSYELPEKFREPVFRAFCDNYNCVLSEAETEDLKQFRNLKEFFTRTLKSELRPISDKIIASPCVA